MPLRCLHVSGFYREVVTTNRQGLTINRDSTWKLLYFGKSGHLIKRSGHLQQVLQKVQQHKPSYYCFHVFG